MPTFMTPAAKIKLFEHTRNRELLFAENPLMNKLESNSKLITGKRMHEVKQTLSYK